MNGLVILLVALLGQQVLAADSICPNHAPLQEGADDFRMQEDEFTQEHALKSVNFLQTDFSERIWGSDAVRDFSAWSGHYISYANSLKFIEGALLKQQVLLESALLRELSLVAPDSEEVIQSRENLKRTRELFCEFLSKSEYVD